MLPISTSDIIEFHPAVERVEAAHAALEAIPALGPDATAEESAASAAKVEEASAEITAAEAALALRDPVYRLRVPDIRSKLAASCDLAAEGIVTKGNADLVAAVLDSADELSAEDAEFVRGLKGDNISADDWSRLYWIARSIPASARILADRAYSANMGRLHSIRHHLIIEGQRNPLPYKVISDLERAHPEDYIAIGNKVDSLIVLSEAEEKN